MEGHWDTALYSPTYNDGDEFDAGFWTRPSDERLTELAKELQQLTVNIIEHPYDVACWYERAIVLQNLGYPELSAVDAYKALQLLHHDPSLKSNFHKTAFPKDKKYSTKRSFKRIARISKRVLDSFTANVKTWKKRVQAWPKDRAEHSSTINDNPEGQSEPGSTPHQPRGPDPSTSAPHARVVNGATEQRPIQELAIRLQLISALRASKAFVDACHLAEQAQTMSSQSVDMMIRLQDSLNDLHEILRAKSARLNRLPIGKQEHDFFLLQGSILVRRYPWMDDHLVHRPQSLVKQLASRLEKGSNGICTVAKSDLGMTSDGTVLGVFALKSIVKGTEILVDRTNSIPNRLDMTSMLNSLQITQGHVRSYTKILLTHLKDIISPYDATHPLTTAATLSLTASYAGSTPREFSLETDVILPTRVLEMLGVDPYRDLQYDGWVIQTIRHRLSNNAAAIGDSPDGEWPEFAITPLVTHVNHSCDPNTAPQPVNGVGVVLVASRDIEAGEELTLSYLGGVRSLGVAERRERLEAWLGGDCRCSRCVGEA